MSIDTEHRWFYNSCKKCTKKVVSDGSLFYYEKCNELVNSVVPRFKIELRMIDESGSAIFIIFDREATKFLQSLQLTDEELKNYALIKFENLLQRNGRSLADFESIPYPDMNRVQRGSNKMHDELSYNRSILVEELQHLLNSFTDEQRCIYDKIISIVNSNDGGVFFVYGYGGTSEKATDESNEGEAMVDIPDDVLINVSDDPIKAIVESTEERIYLSLDSVCRADANIDSMDDLYTTEYLNSIRMSGLPNHMLKLKVGAPVMLLRNIDKSLGLCNGIFIAATNLYFLFLYSGTGKVMIVFE
ncbi:uncharacterized protein [Elaeis guineensis]|uniref:uncharacterized protein n=1 Tax=Elaeis guineensis var. tenera TaxID=51953 RepID=UPI003C6D98E7